MFRRTEVVSVLREVRSAVESISAAVESQEAKSSRDVLAVREEVEIVASRVQELRDLVIRLDDAKSTLITQHLTALADSVPMSVGSQVSAHLERLQADLADARQQILGTLYRN